MAIGLEHLRGPNGEQWTGMSPPQQRSQYPQQKKSQAPQSPFGPQQTVQTSMGNFPNLQAYQQQQDAFVQQHLKNQAQYNQGLQSGQSPQRVPVMDAWRQAGENIQSGQYQGNPFQTGNVDALMGMFGQYGMQAPQGFRDQLLQNLGQQSAPPMYQPQRDYYIDPREMSPGGFIQPGPSQPPQPAMVYPGGPMPPGQMPSNGGFIDAREPGMLYQAVMVPYYNPATGETTSRTAGVVPAPGSGWVRGTGPAANQQQPQMTYPGGPSNDFVPKFTNPATGLPYGQPVTDGPVGPNGEYWPAFRSQPPSMQPVAPPQMTYPGGTRTQPIYRPGGSQQAPPSYDPTAPNTWGRDGGPPGWSEAQRDLERALAALGPTPVMSSNTPAQLLYADAQRRIGELTDTYRDEGIPASSPTLFGGGGSGGVGRAQPTPPRTQGTPYGTRRKKEDEPLDAAPGSSGPGWRESGGKRIYDGYTDPRGTGAVGAVGPNHIRPGMMRDPVTGRPVFDPFTDPIGTGGAPAYARNVPAGNTWGPGTSARREPVYRPSQPGVQRRGRGGDVFGVG